MFRVLTNCLGDLGPIPGRFIPKTQKSYLMPLCLTHSIIRYGTRVKWVNPENGVAPSPTPLCSSFRKGNLRVTVDNGCHLYILLYIYISSSDRLLLYRPTKCLHCGSKPS